MVVVVVVVIVLLIMLFVHSVRLQKTGDVWRATAKELGLPAPNLAFFKPFGVDGTVDGIKFRALELTGEDDSGTSFVAEFRDLRLGLRVSQERTIDVTRVPFIGRVLAGGREDVEVGETGFDDQVRVRGYEADHVAAFLTPTRRQMLMRLLEHFPGVLVTDTEVRWRTRERPNELSSVAAPIRRFVAVALVMQGDDEPLTHAVDALEQGDLGAGLSELEVIEGPLRPEARLLQAEVLASGAGTTEEVGEVLAELDVIVPADPEVAALHDVVEQASPTPAAEPVPALDQELQLDELFGQSTADARAVFDQRYVGRRVRSSGEVRRATRFVNDLDFGAGPGVKAVISIGAVDLGPYGTVEIDAVVAFPSDTELAIGQQVEFTGVPFKLDGFSRNVLLREGTPS